MKKIKSIVEAVLKGIGQIMLQESAWTGLLFLIAISYDSLLMGVGTLLSAIIGTATARICGFSNENIKAGLYGFNATLVGVGLVFFFEASPLIWFLIVLGSVISTLLMEFSIRKKIPFFTFPFIVITVVAVLMIQHFGLAAARTPIANSEMGELEVFAVAAHAYSEVIFQGTIAAGLLFFVGVFLNNPTAALYGFVAAVIAGAIAGFYEDSVKLIEDGMFSFNAVLCGIACSGVKPRDGLYVLLSVVIATYFDIFMMHHGWITLTFPFVFSMWVIVSLKKVVSHFESKNQKQEPSIVK
ncbi:urea transporter [Flavobacterium daemonense]|uniref:urea transporter n=1 Tax=Flavobacterium daemonense TaxID=1393049 RepID=UPI00118581FB|nr:urea transporter [Flavobacterium daemonense]KAF2336997.1 urea transporter [Flavobacterium daemonense]